MFDYDRLSSGFRRAERIGRHDSCWRRGPPEEIRTAIEQLGAQRIGHGTTLLQSRGLVELIRERNICIEACVTSNWHVGAIAGRRAHPLLQWMEQGVPVCICTDNTLLSAVSAPEGTLTFNKRFS